MRRTIALAVILTATACGDAEPKKGNNVIANNMMNNVQNNRQNNQQNNQQNNRVNNQQPDLVVQDWAQRAFAAFCQNDQVCPMSQYDSLAECQAEAATAVEVLAVSCTMVDSFAAESCINAITFAGCDPETGTIAIPDECDQDGFLDCDDAIVVGEEPEPDPGM